MSNFSGDIIKYPHLLFNHFVLHILSSLSKLKMRKKLIEKASSYHDLTAELCLNELYFKYLLKTCLSSMLMI